MDKETFVDSPVYPDKYLVSNYGTVITKKTRLRRKPGVNKDGYLYMRLHDNGESKYMLIHRLVAIAFVSNPRPDEYKVTNHINGVKKDNFFKNLEWCDVGHNTRHSYLLGLQKPMRGSKHGRSIYTEEQIHLVCGLSQDSDLTVSEISTRTGVNVRTIQSVRAGQNWSFISEGYEFTDRRLKRTCND